MIWQDLNTVQLMTTCHSPEEIHQTQHINDLKRNGIPTNARITVSVSSSIPQSRAESENVLPIPLPIRDYNRYMGGSDGNAQTRQYYSFTTRSFRYWWPFFRLLIDASIVNAYKIWKIAQPYSTLTHQQFQHEITIPLVQDPAGNGRRRLPKVQVIGRPATVFPPEHNWVHLSNRQCCLACRVDKIRVSRQPLAEVDGNGAKRRRRGAQTMWGCSACPNSACCKNAKCWDA